MLKMKLALSLLLATSACAAAIERDDRDIPESYTESLDLTSPISEEYPKEVLEMLQQILEAIQTTNGTTLVMNISISTTANLVPEDGSITGSNININTTNLTKILVFNGTDIEIINVLDVDSDLPIDQIDFEINYAVALDTVNETKDCNPNESKLGVDVESKIESDEVTNSEKQQDHSIEDIIDMLN